MATTNRTYAQLVMALLAGRTIVYCGSVEEARGSAVLQLVPASVTGDRVTAVVDLGQNEKATLRGARVESFEIAAPVSEDWEAQLLG